MKRITCILLTCILCFSISGCTKTYKGTDELIEKAREEIPVSDADTIDMQYGGMCTVDDTALVWFISGNQYLEIHYTPKHGSWLDMAEIELNVMTRQCLSRRIETIERLRKELSSWEEELNKSKAKIKWHFQTGDAREKLISLYPNLTTN